MIAVGSPFFIASLGSSPFNPGSVSGLKMWIDAAYVAESGGLASNAIDQSGEGNNLGQTTDLDKPTLVTSWRNGKPALLFSASQGIHRSGFTGGNISQPQTLYVTGSWTDNLSSNQYLFYASNNDQRVRHNTANNVNVISNGGQGSPFAAPAAGTPFILRTVFDGASSESTIYLDGGMTVNAQYTLNAAAMGGTDVLGALDTTGGAGWDGHIANCLVYEGETSASDDAGIINYLQSRYLITPS